MHKLVKILINDDGDEQEDAQWHLSEVDGGGEHTLCTGEFVGVGESGCVYEEKFVERGVPCPLCKEIILRHKAIKL